QSERANLGDGFSVFLKIVEWRADDVVQVPLSSVFRRGTDWAVFVGNAGVAELRTVELGRRNGQMTEILGGLEPGERVVTHPSDAISDGVTLVERTQL
ncbi:MAG: RND transporter, partial [Silicimonas sp.]|nr:RND transporter [Silicimonas sp.]